MAKPANAYKTLLLVKPPKAPPKQFKRTSGRKTPLPVDSRAPGYYDDDKKEAAQCMQA